MNIDFGRFIDNLKYMGIGLIGIFMIIGIIIAATSPATSAAARRTKIKRKNSTR